jgi:hypothetical protein
MSETPDIDPGDGDVVSPSEAAIGAAIATGAGLACLSCASRITGPYCAVCGQRNDDMRRSSLVLVRDFLKDTFAFDSRMWRTLGLMAAAPGSVPNNYSHGKRTRYTPPVRMFLFVSFLFFLVLGLTHTMFVAVEVTAKTAQEIAAEKADLESRLSAAGPQARAALAKAEENAPLVAVDGRNIDCDINFSTRFFVRAKDVRVDLDRWRACSESVSSVAKAEIDSSPKGAIETNGETRVTKEDVGEGFDRVMAGLNQLVANPAAFNAEINTWLPRVMFFMAPVLAILLGLFIRGKDALLFDHLVLSLYSHATAFAIIGAAIILAQLGVSNTFPFAMAALFVYFAAALKRAYGRGWVKTVYSTVFVGFLYLLVLSSVVGSIIANQLWRTAV